MKKEYLKSMKSLSIIAVCLLASPISGFAKGLRNQIRTQQNQEVTSKKADISKAPRHLSGGRGFSRPLVFSLGATLIGTSGVGAYAYGLNKELLRAMESGNPDAVQKLVTRGANVSLTDSQGNTPLLLAVKHGRPDMVRLLVKQGAQVHQPDKSGMTPLSLAEKYGHSEIADWLRNHGTTK